MDNHLANIKIHLKENRMIYEKIKDYEFYIRNSDKDSALQFYEKNLKEDLYKIIN